MKVILDPRIVAARIHGPSFFAHGAATFVAEINASSHGGLRMFISGPKLFGVKQQGSTTTKNKSARGGVESPRALSSNAPSRAFRRNEQAQDCRTATGT